MVLSALFVHDFHPLQIEMFKKKRGILLALRSPVHKLAHVSSVKILMLAGSDGAHISSQHPAGEAEASRSLRQRPFLSTWGAPGPPRLHSETLS